VRSGSLSTTSFPGICEEGGKGLDRFVESNWKPLSKELFGIAAEVQKRIE